MIDTIKSALASHINIHHIEIIDDSARHAGHKQNRGGGHFIAHIISDDFKDKSLIQRHQMVYAALGNLMKNEIHAFSMKTQTTDEFSI